jgi:hypothetical protein
MKLYNKPHITHAEGYKIIPATEAHVAYVQHYSRAYQVKPEFETLVLEKTTVGSNSFYRVSRYFEGECSLTRCYATFREAYAFVRRWFG